MLEQMWTRLTFALLLASLAPAQTRLSIAGRDVAMWTPHGAAPRSGFPVVIFSHGFLGCATQATFLMQALARAGYLALAPDHLDAFCGTAHTSGVPRAQEPFSDPKQWSESTYRDRAEDIIAVLDAVVAAKSFRGVAVDASRVALAGHSLGGYTVLGIAGAWPSWKDTRVRAVLALSPYCEPYLLKGALARMNLPAMYQGGTLDVAVTPFVRRPRGAYDTTSAPKYYIEFKGAGHFAWTDFNAKFQASIARYSVAFFDCYLKGKRAALEALTGKPLPPLVSFLRADPK
jgi:predicted dienelactone hydrolase